jgi:alpha-tubulin suppressor-like RCC1 family protein
MVVVGGLLLGLLPLTSLNAPTGVKAASSGGPFVTRSVSVGYYHSCAVMSDKTVKCWGRNLNGELGDGTQTSRDFPVDVIGVTGARSVVAGWSYSCALLENGTVMCWGSSIYTGTGDSTSIAQPQMVSGLTGVAQISGSLWQACALKNTGEVFCWGIRSDIEGPIPNSYSIAATPYQVADLNNAHSISVGSNHACAVVETAEVKCWGQRYSGSLGDGLIDGSRISSPVTVVGVSSARYIAVGESSNACVVLTNGSVKCWGRIGRITQNDFSINALTPVTIAGFTNAEKVDLNGNEACIIQTAGTLKCLGDPTGTGTGPPAGVWVPSTQVDGITDATELSMGSFSSCVRLSATGYVKCWGSNSTGQIAQGRLKRDFYSPVFLKGPNTIEFSQPPDKSLGDAPYSLAAYASSSSGLPVSFVSSNSPACFAKDDEVIIKAAGSCSIIASQVGSEHVAPAIGLSRVFLVNGWSGVRANAVVTFRFRTTEGLPVTGLRVTWRALGAENPATGTANVTAANGSLTMSVISGPTLISVTSLYQPDDNSSFRKNSVDFFLNNYTTTRLLTQGEVVIDVGQRPSHINKVVNVELADGTPVRGATVFLAVKTNIWEPPSRTLTGKKLTGFATWHTANQANNSWPCGPNGNSYFDSSETNVRGSTDVDGRLVLKAFTSTGSDNQVTACYNDTEFAQTRTVSFSPSGPTTIVLGYMARVNVSVSSLSVASGGSESVSAQVVDANGSPVSSQSVQVMAGSVDSTATPLTCAGSRGTTNANGRVTLNICPSASGNYFLKSNGALSSRLIYVAVGSSSPAAKSGGGGGGGDDDEDAAPVVSAPKSTPTTTTAATRIIAAPKAASVPVMPAKAGVVVPNVVQPKAAVAQGLAIAASSNSLTVALKAPVSSSSATKITSYVVTMRSSTGAFLRRVVVPVQSSGQTVAPSFKVAKAGNYVIEISGRNSKGKSLGSYKSAPVKVGK